MSETLLAAMAHSRRPEEFVQFLLKAARTGRLPSARKFHLGGKGRVLVELDKFVESLPKGDYHTLSFFPRGSPRSVCYFDITGVAKGDSPENVAGARVKLFGENFFQINAGDFSRAAAKAGTLVVSRKGTRVKFVSILIPHALIDHDEWSGRLKPAPPGHEQEINIEIDPRLFNELHQNRDSRLFMRRYFDTLDYLQERMSVGEYSQRLSIKEYLAQKHPHFSTYQLFHFLNKGYQQVMQEIAGAHTAQQLSKTLRRHLTVGSKQANTYARLIMSECKNKSGLDAVDKIARDSRLTFEKIREIR